MLVAEPPIILGNTTGFALGSNFRNGDSENLG